MKSYRYFLPNLISILLLILGAAWIWISRNPGYAQQTRSSSAPLEGFIAPNFTLNSLSNETITLSDLRGFPVVLNFWASWCPPCRAEMPAFQLVFDEYQTNDVVILGINATNQDLLDAVVEFAAAYQLDFPILLDQSGSVGRLYNIHSLPTTFFIDRDGYIQKFIIGGPIPVALLRVQIDELLRSE